MTSGQQHGLTHDSEPPDAVARPSRRRRSRRHRESNLPDGKCGTTMLYLGSGWGFFGVGWLGEVVRLLLSFSAMQDRASGRVGCERQSSLGSGGCVV